MKLTTLTSAIALVLLVASSSSSDASPVFHDDQRLPKVEPLSQIKEKELEEAINQYCRSQSATYNAIKNACSRSTWTVFAKNVAVIVMNSAISSCANAFFIDHPSSNMIQAQTVAVSIVEASKNFVGNLAQCPQDELNQLEDLHEFLVNNSKPYMQSSLNIGFENFVSKYDQIIRDYIRACRVSAFNKENPLTSTKKEAILNALKIRQTVLMSLPNKPLNVNHNEKGGNKTLLSILNGNISKLLDTVTSESRDSLMSLISTIRDNSIDTSASSNSSENTSSSSTISEDTPTPSSPSREEGVQLNTHPITRAQAYLYGPPGTGKTRFVRYLAKTLGLPLCEISLSKSPSTVILGQSMDHLYDLEKKEKTSAMFGLLVDCFVKYGVTNPIIFVDEAGDAIKLTDSSNVMSRQDNTIGMGYQSPDMGLMSMLKLIFEPSSPYIPVMYGSLKLDISKATFIFAGNYELKDSALRSRLPTIKFSALSKEQKKEIIDKTFNLTVQSQMEKYEKNDVVSYTKPIQNLLPYVLKVDIESNPGGRISKQVINCVIAYSRSKYFNGEKNILQKSLKRQIDTCFQETASGWSPESSDGEKPDPEAYPIEIDSDDEESDDEEFYDPLPEH